MDQTLRLREIILVPFNIGFIKVEILFLNPMQDIIELIELKDFIFIDLTERLWDWYILIII